MVDHQCEERGNGSGGGPGRRISRWAKIGEIRNDFGSGYHPSRYSPIAKVFLGNGCNVGSRRVLDYYGKRLTALDVICFSSLSVVEEIGR